MDLIRDDGAWAFQNVSDEERSRKPDYIDALPRYLNIFDPLFERAQEADEFEFICSLLAIRGLESAGWDAYRSTLEAVEAMVQLHQPNREVTVQVLDAEPAAVCGEKA